MSIDNSVIINLIDYAIQAFKQKQFNQPQSRPRKVNNKKRSRSSQIFTFFDRSKLEFLIVINEIAFPI